MFNLGNSHFTLRILAILLALLGCLIIGGKLDDLLNMVNPGMGNQFNQGVETLNGAGKNFCGDTLRDLAPEVTAVCDTPAQMAQEAQKISSDMEQTGKNAENLFSKWWRETTKWWSDLLK